MHSRTHRPSPTPPRRKRLCEQAAACATAMRPRGRRASERRQRHAACGCGGSSSGDDALDDALGGSTADRGRACSGGGVHSQISCHGHGTCMAIDKRRSWQRKNLAGDSSVASLRVAKRQGPRSRLGPVPPKLRIRTSCANRRKAFLRRRAAGRCERAAGSVVRQVVRWKLGGRALGAGRIGERAKIRLRRPKFRSSGPDCEMLRMRATDSAVGRRRVGG